MPVMQLRRPAASAPPPQSDARRRLAEAIESLNATVARIAALEDAFSRTSRDRIEAQAAHAAATEAVKTALRAASDYAVAKALGNAVPPPPLSVAAARAAVQEAADAVTTAEQVRDTLQSEATALPGKLPLRQMAVTDAALAVMREEGAGAIAAVFDRIDAASREFFDAGMALVALIDAGIVIDRGPGAHPNAIEFSCRASATRNWALWNVPNAAPTAAMWRAAWAALKTDATTPVPVVPRVA